MPESIPVIDLFAGPGGLGEGFASLGDSEGKKNPFRVAISVENEASAHRTLTLRALYRQFPRGKVPESYYEFLRGGLGINPEDELYRLPELAGPLEKARNEARKFTLGENHRAVYDAIKQAVGKKECVLIGGPPCQAYSLVGRSRNYGDKSKNYVASEDHRNFLYIEYLRIVSRFQPLVFVMENVKGILSAKVDGMPIFDSIAKDLKDPCKAVSTKPDLGRQRHQYRLFSFVRRNEPDLLGNHPNLKPRDYLIRSEDFGVPQARHRVILFGVRKDLLGARSPDVLQPAEATVSVRSVISDLPRLRSRLSKESDSPESWIDAVREFPSIATNGSIDRRVAKKILRSIDQLTRPKDDLGAVFGLQRKPNNEMPEELAAWFLDERLGRFVTNHDSRGHIRADLHRYLFSSAYSKAHQTAPKSNHFPPALWPKHESFGTGRFADRFRVQLANRPGTTVTCHISKDGHYYIHYDPTQCRSLTVREAARIQTFPDNYFFVGNRTQQYVQVGNAVPPYLANQLARIVHALIRP
jgi:DNA (cytosine-5)-methyltransferase 1